MRETGEQFNKSAFFGFKKKKTDYDKDHIIPATFSLKQYCPQSGDQNFGTCYSYATAYSARTILFNIENNETNNTDANIFSPGFIQKLMVRKRRRCKRRGASTHTACKIIAEKGVVKRVDYPSDCSEQSIDQNLRTKAIEHRSKIQRVVNPGMKNDKKTELIKLSISEKKPVVITVFSKKTSMLKNTNGDLWKPTRTDLSKANSKKSHHAMCIIGYDDNKYGGAYEVLNSYGDDWMNKGYFWIQYKDFNPFISSAIEMGSINQ